VAERLGQLVAPAIAETLVLLSVNGIGVGEHLARELLVVARRALRRVGVNLGAVDGDHPRVDETGIRTQSENLAEDAGERIPMTLAKPRDRRVVGNPVSGDNAEGHVFLARPLDRARRSDPARVRVEHQRDHHRRLKRRPAVPILPIGAIERAQIHPRDRVQHEPRKVRLRQPVADVGRQQERLLAVGGKEVLPHARNRLNLDRALGIGNGARGGGAGGDGVRRCEAVMAAGDAER